MEIMIDCY